MSRSEAARQVRESSTLNSEFALQQQVHRHLDHYFPDLQHVSEAGPSDLSRGKGKRKRTLRDEILHWEKEEVQAAQELEESSAILPGLLDDAQTKLQSFLSEGQKLSLRRYDLSDKLTKVSSELEEELEEEDGIIGSTLMDKMESLHAELERLESGLIWASIIEQVLQLSERILSPKEHYPSPLAALPHYHALHELVLDLNQRLPPGLSLLTSIQDVESRSWKGLHDILMSNLVKASEQIKWPSKVQYTLLPETDRRAFERAYKDLLFLQVEDEMLRPGAQAKSAWYEVKGLFPLKAMIQPIALRFQYHFQGTKTTNRLDKPEWAFSNILDQIYEHSQFLATIIQPLTASSGFPEISVKSEFVLLLLPILLDMLRSRVPKLLDHPALLAHTVYQTILFDDAIRDGRFDISSTSASESMKEGEEWEGLAGVILKEEAVSG